MTAQPPRQPRGPRRFVFKIHLQHRPRSSICKRVEHHQWWWSVFILFLPTKSTSTSTTRAPPSSVDIVVEVVLLVLPLLLVLGPKKNNAAPAGTSVGRFLIILNRSFYHRSRGGRANVPSSRQVNHQTPSALPPQCCLHFPAHRPPKKSRAGPGRFPRSRV